MTVGCGVSGVKCISGIKYLYARLQKTHVFAWEGELWTR